MGPSGPSVARRTTVLALSAGGRPMPKAAVRGELTLNRERLGISGAEHLMLVVYHPDAGSGDAGKLNLLASAAGAR